MLTVCDNESVQLVRSDKTSSKSSVLDIGADSEINDNECDADESALEVSTLRIWKMGFPEWKFMALGGVFSLLRAQYICWLASSSL